jgi:hypothetical protein
MQQVEQVAFEGLEVEGLRFQLKGTTDLMTEHPCAVGDVVSGTFKGTVVGVHHEWKSLRGGTSIFIRKHIIDVDDGVLDGAKPTTRKSAPGGFGDEAFPE